ncbi:MAG: CoA-binding protein [Persicimonas sp.]
MDASQAKKWRAILDETERIAVIGMKPSGAAFSVPLFMERQGFEIVPVNPMYDEIDGRESFVTVNQVDGRVEMVNIFRRSDAIPGHVEEILKMDPLPNSVWLQLGIRHDAAARRLLEAGIEVIQDRCIKVEYARLRSR